MGKKEAYMVQDAAQKVGISRSRIYQLINGYLRRDGVFEEPVLIEGLHFNYKRVEHEGAKQRSRRVSPILTDEGLRKLKEVVGAKPGPKKKED